MNVSTAVSPPAERTNYLNETQGLASWLLTKDHKRIAVLYLISVSVFFLLGGLFATFGLIACVITRAIRDSNNAMHRHGFTPVAKAK